MKLSMLLKVFRIEISLLRSKMIQLIKSIKADKMNQSTVEVTSEQTNYFGSKQFLQTGESCRRCCRICLGYMESAKIYCKCKGPQRYIHDECLLAWIKTAQIQSQFGEFFCACEVCKQKIPLKMQKKCRLNGLGNLCQNIKCSQGQTKYEQIGLLIIFIVMVILFIVMLQRYVNRHRDVYLILTIVFGTILMLFCCCFCFKKVVVMRQEVVGLYQRGIFKDNNRQIIPT